MVERKGECEEREIGEGEGGNERQKRGRSAQFS